LFQLSLKLRVPINGKYTCLVLSNKLDNFDGQDVKWARLGEDVNNALKVYYDGECIRLANEPTFAFDCSMAKYNCKNKIPIFFNHRGDNQKFV